MVLLNLNAHYLYLKQSMKNKKEYNVSKLKIGNSYFYFLDNDFIVVGNNFISCKRRKITNNPINKDDFEELKRRLDYISNNDLTITL